MALRRTADRLNFDLVWRDYYSPVPDVSRLAPETWRAEASLVGIAWNAGEQVDLLGRLRPLMESFAASPPPPPFKARNDSYEGADAAFLHAMLTTLRPRRVVELGAGYSTLVAAAALHANARDGASANFVSLDPFPSPVIDPPPEGLSRLQVASAQQRALGLTSQLEAGDVLFVDTTHVAKLGSDVNHIFHEVLPSLAPGVTVHVHDVFLPWDYPERWSREQGYYWNEQYVLQSFLAFNGAFKVLAALHWLFRTQPKCFPESLRSAPPPSGFWMRRTESGA